MKSYSKRNRDLEQEIDDMCDALAEDLIDDETDIEDRLSTHPDPHAVHVSQYDGDVPDDNPFWSAA